MNIFIHILKFAIFRLYDDKGSELFESICDIPDYYPTQQEISLLRNIVQELTVLIEPNSVLIELGSGASIKTRILLGM